MAILIVGCAFPRNDLITKLQGIYEAGNFGPLMAKRKEKLTEIIP